MADASPVSGEDLKRAEKFARESFVLDGEDAATALAEDGPRRAALDAALKEIDAGRTEPSLEWRREFSLMLGLERLLAAVRHADRARSGAPDRPQREGQRRSRGAPFR